MCEHVCVYVCNTLACGCVHVVCLCVCCMPVCLDVPVWLHVFCVSMLMHVCARVCVHDCVYIFWCTCVEGVSVCACSMHVLSMLVCIHVSLHIWCLHMCVCVNVCTCVSVCMWCLYMCVHVCSCVCEASPAQEPAELPPKPLDPSPEAVVREVSWPQAPG